MPVRFNTLSTVVFANLVSAATARVLIPDSYNSTTC